jgi:hypothetical protein
MGWIGGEHLLVTGEGSVVSLPNLIDERLGLHAFEPALEGRRSWGGLSCILLSTEFATTDSPLRRRAAEQYSKPVASFGCASFVPLIV